MHTRLWYNPNVKVPAARRVAERPAPATWPCGQIAVHGFQASLGIGPQVTTHLAPAPDFYPYDTYPANTPLARNVAWMAYFYSWKIGVQVIPLFLHASLLFLPKFVVASVLK